MENKEQQQLTEEEKAIVANITTQIQTACTQSKYVHICHRIKTDNGLAYVVNRCIKMMANDSIKLSTALAYLETEMEGMD